MTDKNQTEAFSTTNKNIDKLLKAIDNVYGNVWRLTWRNFLAGLMHALGATIGYVLFIGIAILIADKLGIFEAVQNFWQNTLQQLPLQLNSAMRFDTDILKQSQP